jgi:hypothetical protein
MSGQPCLFIGTVLAGSGECTNLDHWNPAIVGSNPVRGMDCVTFFCVLPSCIGRGIAVGRSPVQGDKGKCKVVPVLNKAPRHEGVMGREEV